MPRIDIELTSTQPGGAWTWRAAGARQPKGVLDGSLLEGGAQVGDVLRAECDIDLDGTRVTAVLASRTKRPEPDLLAIQGSGQEAPLVTQDGGAPDLRGERPRREGRPDRRPNRDRDAGGRPGGQPGGGRGAEFPGGGRPGGAPGGPPRGPRGPGTRSPGDRGPRPAAPTEGERGSRPPRGDDRRRADRPSQEQPHRPRRGRPEPSAPPATPKPRPKRLQPGRVHREAILAELPPEQRAVAEKVLRGGLPSVRQAVEDQNAEARSTGAPEVRADALVAMAESLLPRLRAAEWRDRAEAAAAAVSEIGLRDLRAVVAGSDAAGRDDDCRALATRLREALEQRSTEERESWVAEIRSSLVDGRVVRALRVSGRAPDPSARFPADLAEQLSAAAGAAMTADTVADRWAALLDAVVASPVRRTVQPQGVPAVRADDLERALRLAAPRVPALAALLGPPRPPRPAAPRGAEAARPAGSRPPRRGAAAEPRRARAAPVAAAHTTDAEAPAAEAPAAEAPAAVAPVPMADADASAPAAVAPVPVADAGPGEGTEAEVPVSSGDDRDDAVLVEELS